ncbi:NADH-dependent iron-containing alcohol dehydrogenase [Neokomagataea thailandica NBRC 106555]|uniref:Iron-containing alcohol dehydrogenase n=2 Tax=Neokomagataea TaxID=1223423 RepID=A0A4Y6VBQ8_9PROT|nr:MULTISPECIES: iron-containing alcohol dehydrogenase [Neokomagataea]QDH25981.1 iron-containing alcohol dehydrogenase [Neokomagataea tanensis]GBR50724.1 NADH-dependent iron-containing alcohol dehydrogenase [Neokomagataea thailandica NBRC 106555]
MLNFEFYNPTKIIFGKGTVPQIANNIPKTAKILVLYGGSSAEKTGTLKEVRTALTDHQFEEFGGIEANPTFETLMRAVDVVRSNNIDYLLAVGGGSVVDGTKFVAAAADFEGDAWDILKTHGQNITSALPIGVVLTVPATGSEMNSFSVITKASTSEKLGLSSPLVFPKFSVLDPTKAYTLSEKQIANGVADSFVHILEQYLTYPSEALAQDRFSEGLLVSLIDIGPRIVKDRENYDLQSNLMWIATLALNGLIGAGVPQDWSTHMIGHELTARYHIDHARTLVSILPAVLRVRKESKRLKLLQFAERVWGIHEGTDDERIEAAIEKTAAFFEALGIPASLRSYEIDEAGVDAIITQLEQHNMVALGEKQDVTLDVSRKILVESL